MAASVLRSAGRVLRRSIPQGLPRQSPMSNFVGKVQHNKYSTSSSGVQTEYLNHIAEKNKVNVVKYQLLDAKMDELTHVIGGLKKEFKELELVLEKKDAVARRYARQRPFKMLAGVTVGFGLGFYANQRISGRVGKGEMRYKGDIRSKPLL